MADGDPRPSARARRRSLRTGCRPGDVIPARASHRLLQHRHDPGGNGRTGPGRAADPSRAGPGRGPAGAAGPVAQPGGDGGGRRRHHPLRRRAGRSGARHPDRPAGTAAAAGPDRPGGGRGRGRPARHRRGACWPASVRELHRPAARGPAGRGHPPRRPGRSGLAPGHPHRPAALDPAPRRQHRLRSRRAAVDGHRRRQPRWGPGRRGAVAGGPVRQAAASGSNADRRQGLQGAHRQPVRGPAGRPPRDLGVWPAQPVALLVRPRHRRPLDRRRRPVRHGGDRRRLAAPVRRRQLRLEPAGRTTSLQRQPAASGGPAGPPVQPRRRPLRGGRWPRLSGHPDPRPAGRLPLRRRVRRRIRALARAGGRSLRHRDLPLRLPGLVSLAEDRAGELYALSLAGGIYRLAAVG